MSKSTNSKKRFCLIFALTAGLSCFGYMACGGNDESVSNSESGGGAVAPFSQEENLSSSDVTATAVNVSAIPAG